MVSSRSVSLGWLWGSLARILAMPQVSVRAEHQGAERAALYPQKLQLGEVGRGPPVGRVSGRRSRRRGRRRVQHRANQCGRSVGRTRTSGCARRVCMIEMTRSAGRVRASPIRVRQAVRRGHHHLVAGPCLGRRQSAERGHGPIVEGNAHRAAARHSTFRKTPPGPWPTISAPRSTPCRPNSTRPNCVWNTSPSPARPSPASLTESRPRAPTQQEVGNRGLFDGSGAAGGNFKRAG